MDTPALPIGYFEEGGSYLAAVEALGLRPAAFFWAFDRITETFVLVLITDEFDAVGPLALSKILFKAYIAEATPRAIDPFIIRLYSPLHQIVREMDKIMPFKFEQGAPIFKNGQPVAKAARAVTNVGGLEIDGDWVYRFDKPLSTAKTVDVLRRWHRFERNVDKKAA
jgi:hypothetical protein